MSNRLLVACVASLTVLVLAPVAWAVGWVTVGGAGVHLNDIAGMYVQTANPVYSSDMRLYVATHSPCGGPNFYMEYDYPQTYEPFAYSSLREICTAAQTPSFWNQSGGNKYAVCSEWVAEYTNPASTCQRYSTT